MTWVTFMKKVNIDNIDEIDIIAKTYQLDTFDNARQRFKIPNIQIDLRCGTRIGIRCHGHYSLMGGRGTLPRIARMNRTRPKIIWRLFFNG